jgi:hypothetical protein
MLGFDPTAWSPEAWTAIAAWLTVTAYAVIAVFALNQVREARTLREEQARPFVVAEFVPGFLIKFRIQNVGHTLARNVRIAWEPWPIVTAHFSNDALWKSPTNSVLFSSGIPSLAPQQQLETLFDHFPDRVSNHLPMRYRVRVEYDSFDTRRHFTETYELDLELFHGLRNISRKDVHDVANTLDRLQVELAKWSDGPYGLKVRTSRRSKSVRLDERPYRLTSALREMQRDGVAAMLRHEWHEFRDRHGLYYLE